MSYGVITYYEDKRVFETDLSDDEIIERAKSLGLVELKEQISTNNIETIETTEATDTTETIDTTEGE